MSEMPRTIDAYLARLREELAGADPALIQDATNDAEEYLRSEYEALPPDRRDAGVAGIIERYGSPAEVAAANRQTERTVQAALAQHRPSSPPLAAGAGGAEAGAPPEAPPAVEDRPERAGRRRPEGFLGVFVDPLAYTSFFYMLLSLATGILYFTWVVTGLSLSAGLLVLIIGIPFFLLFVITVRVLSFVEGRIVEALLGVRMPRRPPRTDTEGSIWQRAKNMLLDGRTWSTMIYMTLKLPLGIIYFTLAVTLISLAAGLLFYPVAQVFWPHPLVEAGDLVIEVPPWGYPLVSIAGFVLLVLTLHLARFVGTVHAVFAKGMLVRASQSRA